MRSSCRRGRRRGKYYLIGAYVEPHSVDPDGDERAPLHCSTLWAEQAATASTQREPWYRSIQTPSQRIFVALVKALDAVAIVAFVTDLHLGAQRADGRKFLDHESDCLRCGRKPAIAHRLPRPTLALGHEQLGRCAVVECRGLIFGRHIGDLTRIARKYSPRVMANRKACIRAKLIPAENGTARGAY